MHFHISEVYHEDPSESLKAIIWLSFLRCLNWNAREHRVWERGCFSFFRKLLRQGVILWLALTLTLHYRDADKSLARTGRKQANVSLRMLWISFGALPCREKKNLMTARFSMLLKSCASLKCFLPCFLPGRAKDLSAPQ